eukprot:TRINITY_DN57932_c0_g1_i1.p1 TRINITY_DN57932_c0_g1~~TRINITY_DN57932_c0_g1_i1.p1  ORF type:complete len:552 (+),score=158.54 TRINITY_DN57932_c0_g1_i1:108-1763(+)
MASILDLRVRVDGGEQFHRYLDLDEVRAEPTTLYLHMDQLATEAAGCCGSFRATYRDDEGDECTLTPETCDDALTFRKTEEGCEGQTLDIIVHSEGHRVPSGYERLGETTPLLGQASKARMRGADAAACNETQAARIVRTFRLQRAVAQRVPSPDPERAEGGGGSDEGSGAAAAAAEEAKKLREALREAKRESQFLRERLARAQGQVELAAAEAQQAHAATVHLEELANRLQRDLAAQAATATQDIEAARTEVRLANEEAARRFEQAAREISARKEAEAQARDLIYQAREAEAGARAEAESSAQALLEQTHRAYAAEQAQAECEEKMRRMTEEFRWGRDEQRQAREHLEAKAEHLEGRLRKELERAQKHRNDAAEVRKELEELRQSYRAGPGVSIRVLECSTMMLGIEAEDDETARGDASSEFADLLEEMGAEKAYRIGRVQLPAGVGYEAATGRPLGPVPASMKVTLANNGAKAWPETAVLALASGESHGLPLLPLGALQPGDAAEAVLDLNIPRRNECATTTTVWALRDAATGALLGPLLVFEASWTDQ